MADCLCFARCLLSLVFSGMAAVAVQQGGYAESCGCGFAGRGSWSADMYDVIVVMRDKCARLMACVYLGFECAQLNL
jgi:hypothetical protein